MHLSRRFQELHEAAVDIAAGSIVGEEDGIFAIVNNVSPPRSNHSLEGACILPPSTLDVFRDRVVEAVPRPS